MRKKMKNGNLFSWCWFSSLRTVHKARLNHHFLVSTLGLPWPLHSWTPDPSCCCCSLVVKSCLSFATPWAIACQALLSMGLPRQKYWGGLPFPSRGDLSGTKLVSPTLQVDSSPLSHWGSPLSQIPVIIWKSHAHGCCPKEYWPYKVASSFSSCLAVSWLIRRVLHWSRFLLSVFHLLWRASSSPPLPPPLVHAPPSLLIASYTFLPYPMDPF